MSGCSPRNPLEVAGDDDDGSSPEATCEVADNGWPGVLAEHSSYQGTGVSQGDFLPNFQLKDQHGNDTCLNQFLGSVLIVDASTRWCGPCNEAAAESAVLWEHMKEIGPSWILTLMVQDFTAAPATSRDVEEWVDMYDIEYPVLLDVQEQTSASWQVNSYPLFFFIAPTGEIIERIEQRPPEAEILAFVQRAVEDWASDLRPQD
tara:strand:+ start:569 stop:1180 length:612 start_codon:yes stop_codon:yes gene_type:complete